MSQSVCKWSGVLAKQALVGALMCSVSLAWAQGSSANLAQKLVGSWTLVAQYVMQDGKKVEPFGPSPRGFLLYDDNRRFTSILLRSDLPKFASGNRMTGTAEENKAVVQGSIAFFGQWSVNDKGQLTSRIDGATYPNWDGVVQPREISFSGEEMTSCIPGGASIGGTACSIWRRLK